MSKRWLQVTHTYSVPVPEEAFDLPDWDSLSNKAMSMMEEHMQRLNPNMRDLVTHWQEMPREYAPIDETVQTGTVHRGRNISLEEAAARGGQVTFVDDIMGGVGGVTSPYDQGLTIFPPDHPLHEAEKKMLADDEEEKIIDAEPPKQIEP